MWKIKNAANHQLNLPIYFGNEEWRVSNFYALQLSNCRPISSSSDAIEWMWNCHFRALIIEKEEISLTYWISNAIIVLSSVHPLYFHFNAELQLFSVFWKMFLSFQALIIIICCFVLNYGKCKNFDSNCLIVMYKLWYFWKLYGFAFSKWRRETFVWGFDARLQ